VVRKGEGAQIVEKVPKTKRSRRVIDIDPWTLAVLRAHEKEYGTLALALVRDDALAFGDQEGRQRRPERLWRAFKSAQRQAKALGDGAPPVIAIHDLRHTHATALLADREPVKTVSERLGHASITVTLAVYGHVMPGDQKRAADRFAALVRVRRDALKYQGSITSPYWSRFQGSDLQRFGVRGASRNLRTWHRSRWPRSSRLGVTISRRAG
jgi:integrase